MVKLLKNNHQKYFKMLNMAMIGMNDEYSDI